MKRFLQIMLVALFCLALPAQTFSPVNTPVFRAFDSNGAPLVGGLLWSYQAGTTTPKATYTDASGSTPNTNPVVLDSTGQAKVFLGAGSYKFVLQNSVGGQQWTVDQIAGPLAPGVNSFNTRAGTVVPAIGDYDCAMVTNCPVLPTFYYQTVQVSTTALAQEPALNFVSAGGIGTFTITAGGTSYTTSPTVTFTGGGCTTEPTGAATVAGGAVTGGVISMFGAGCTSPPTPGFSGGGGSGAAGATTLAPAGIACVDNPTNTSTDCTVTNAAVSGDSATTCGANGCFFKKVDGTLVEWGTATGCTTSDNTACDVTVTFPQALTSTSNLSIVVSCINSPGNCTAAIASSPTTSGFTGQFSSTVLVGGGGGHLSGTELLHWQAFQKN